MYSLLQILLLILDIAFWVVMAHVILSWLINFQVLNLRQPLVAQIWDGLNRVLEPIYGRIRNVLLQSAASELASRQRAMHTATDNAQDLITKYTRLANSARQAEITQQISEIVGGADALSSAK